MNSYNLLFSRGRLSSQKALEAHLCHSIVFHPTPSYCQRLLRCWPYPLPSAGGHLGWYRVLAALNDAAVNIHTYGFVYTRLFLLLGTWERSAESCGSPVCDFLKTCHTAFQAAAPAVFPPAMREGARSSASSTTPVFSWIVSHLVGVKWYLRVLI